MKRFGSIVLVTFMLIGLSAYSKQRQQFRGGVGKNPDKIGNADCKIPNLTDEQQQKINDLRVKHIKDVTPLKYELGEKYKFLLQRSSSGSASSNKGTPTISNLQVNSHALPIEAP